MQSTDIAFLRGDGTELDERLFSDVDLSQPQGPETHEVRLVNRHDRDRLQDARVWVETIDAPLSLSADSQTWWPAHSELLSLSLGDLPPGEQARFWVRRDPGGDPTSKVAWLRWAGMVEVR